jgi:hypothetical protein
MSWLDSFGSAMKAIAKNGAPLVGDILANLPAAASGRAGLLGGPLLAIGGGIGDYLLQGQQKSDKLAKAAQYKKTIADLQAKGAITPGQAALLGPLADMGQYPTVGDLLKQPTPLPIDQQGLQEYQKANPGDPHSVTDYLALKSKATARPVAPKVPPTSAEYVQAARELSLSTDPSAWTAAQARAISAQVAQNKLAGSPAPLPEIIPAMEGDVSGFETIPRSRTGTPGKPTFTPFGSSVSPGKPPAPPTAMAKATLSMKGLANLRALDAEFDSENLLGKYRATPVDRQNFYLSKGVDPYTGLPLDMKGIKAGTKFFMATDPRHAGEIWGLEPGAPKPQQYKP